MNASPQVIPDVGLVIATKGRAAILADTLRWTQGRRTVPRQIVVVGTGEDDLAAEPPEGAAEVVQVCSPRPGLPVQRNYGVGQLAPEVTKVIFIDDDSLVHDDYCREVSEILERNLELAAFSGRVVANGGLSYEEACRKLESEEIVHGMPDWSPLRKDWAGLYGCTMNIRRAAVVAEPFDERLPLYAIGEDTEIGFRLRRFGRIGGSARCIIIHLAASSGRVTEKGVGYAQIINFIYYAHKGIGFPFWPTYYERLVRVPLANLLFTCFPKRDKSTNCDRRGRLLGNCIAFRDLLLGRVQPERLLKVLGKA